MQPIDFWFSIGSTYSYLAVMRLQAVSNSTQIPFRWRPFNIRTVTIKQNNRPFVGKPVKTAYMWRDIERRADMYGLPFAGAAPYPLEEMELANRVAVIGAREGWCEAYSRATYSRWFLQGQPAGSSPNLEDSIREIGQDPERVIALGRSDDIGAELEDMTADAMALGVFGSPTFVVGDELFWGDDRLTDAISWYREGRVNTEAGV